MDVPWQFPHSGCTTAADSAEGQALCRSILAEAMFGRLLERMAEGGTPLNVSVASAALGPAFLKHDSRVVRLAREAGLQLPQKHCRTLDLDKDPTDFDLIIAMDRFDFEEVGSLHGRRPVRP